jgi:hypothetical protein
LPIGPDAAKIRSFSWDGDGDSAWEVRFYPKAQNSTPIIRKVTGDPYLQIALPDGLYTWYVFPIIEGVRSEVAVVAADYDTGS